MVEPSQPAPVGATDGTPQPFAHVHADRQAVDPAILDEACAGASAVHVSRWEWDGHTPRRVDDPPRSAMAAVASPAGHGDGGSDTATDTVFGAQG